MKMKVSGVPGTEMEGHIARCYTSEGSLVLEMQLTKPAGWQAKAMLSRRDTMTLVKLFCSRPVNLLFLLFGFETR
jgi:hypothetical protein